MLNVNVKPMNNKRMLSLDGNIFTIRDKIFNDENLKMRLSFIQNRIPQTVAKEKLVKDLVSNRMVAKSKNTQSNFERMDYDNVKLLYRIKEISNKTRSPEIFNNNWFEMRRRNLLNSSKERRKMSSKEIEIQNKSMYNKLNRVSSPLSKKKMIDNYKKLEKVITNARNLKGFSKGVNDRVEKMVTPYLPRLSPRRKNESTDAMQTMNKSPSLSPKSAAFKYSSKITKASEGSRLGLVTKKSGYSSSVLPRIKK